MDLRVKNHKWLQTNNPLNPQGAPSKETYNMKMLEWAFDEDQLGSAKSAFEMIISNI